MTDYYIIAILIKERQNKQTTRETTIMAALKVNDLTTLTAIATKQGELLALQAVDFSVVCSLETEEGQALAAFLGCEWNKEFHGFFATSEVVDTIKNWTEKEQSSVEKEIKFSYFNYLRDNLTIIDPQALRVKAEEKEAEQEYQIAFTEWKKDQPYYGVVDGYIDDNGNSVSCDDKFEYYD